MLVLWFLQLGVKLVGWFSGLFPQNLTIPYPTGGLDLSIPVPAVGSTFITVLNVWFVFSVLVVAALVSGRLMMWIYRIIPFNG